MKINIKEVPFSRRGSYFAISYLESQGALFIRDVHGGDGSPSELFEIRLEDILNPEQGSEEPIDAYDIICDETMLKIQSKQDKERMISIILPTEDSMHIKVEGLKFKLIAHKVRYDTLNKLDESNYEYISYKKETKYALSFVGHDFVVDAPWYRVGNEYIEIEINAHKEIHELLMVNYKVIHKGLKRVLFTDSVSNLRKTYASWVSKFSKVGSLNEDSAALAKYIIWSSIVRAEGNLKHEAVYMSKNWMQNIWSWDNCFNAMALGDVEPELAYKQFEIFVDHQDESGVYPDFINDLFKSYNCCKPPIHAWAYQILRGKSDYFSTQERFEAIYESIAKSTKFWLNHRMGSLDLAYYTHGNDSGWDNASIFHGGLPVVSPDLNAYLIQQMDLLSQWAQELDRVSEASFWKNEANALYDIFMNELFDGDKFIAKSEKSHQVIQNYGSLILRLPLVISYRLPSSVTELLVEQLVSDFEGEFGLSTEAMSSDLYQSDGYWLGPIWAPESYIFFDALLRSGYEDIASRVAEKYCKAGNIGGMAENFNPETAEGNDDLSFTWTSSVFLMMAQYLEKISH